MCVELIKTDNFRAACLFPCPTGSELLAFVCGSTFMEFNVLVLDGSSDCRQTWRTWCQDVADDNLCGDFWIFALCRNSVTLKFSSFLTVIKVQSAINDVSFEIDTRNFVCVYSRCRQTTFVLRDPSYTLQEVRYWRLFAFDHMISFSKTDHPICLKFVIRDGRTVPTTCAEGIVAISYDGEMAPR